MKETPQQTCQQRCAMMCLWGTASKCDSKCIRWSYSTLDIAARSVSGRQYEKTYLDVCIFNPHTPTNRQDQLSQSYTKNECVKKREYKQKVREVEHASFTPLVLVETGGMANEATYMYFYKRLASLLVKKWSQSYSSTISWLCCLLSFSS